MRVRPDISAQLLESLWAGTGDLLSDHGTVAHDSKWILCDLCDTEFLQYQIQFQAVVPDYTSTHCPIQSLEQEGGTHTCKSHLWSLISKIYHIFGEIYKVLYFPLLGLCQSPSLWGFLISGSRTCGHFRVWLSQTMFNILGDVDLK